MPHSKKHLCNSIKFTAIAFLILCLFSTSAYGATFKGRVIDADTKEPIEGAVVVASWHEMLLTAPQSITRFKDVKETLTNKDGEWKIEGPKGTEPGFITGTILLILGLFADKYYTKPPEFIVFKPGYCSWPARFGIKICEERMKTYNFTKSKGIGEVVELPKLTDKEDRLKALPTPIHLVDQMSEEEVLSKQKNFIRLLNEENNYLGLGELPYLKYLKELKDEK